MSGGVHRTPFDLRRLAERKAQQMLVDYALQLRELGVILGFRTQHQDAVAGFKIEKVIWPFSGVNVTGSLCAKCLQSCCR